MSFLETERLALRRFTAADIDSLVELDSDPAVMRYVTGGVPTPRSFIEKEVLPRFLGSYAAHHGHGVWAAIEKSTGAFLGWFSFRTLRGSDPEEIELGYRLRQTAWGQGYATEGAQALIDKGFRQLGAQRVVASTYQDNLASRRVMDKLGMTLERAYRPTLVDLEAAGTFQVTPDLLWDRDEVEYGLSKEKWERKQAVGHAQERTR
jgi:RimJ/RimL family protein N-acetyltransferase